MSATLQEEGGFEVVRPSSLGEEDVVEDVRPTGWVARVMTGFGRSKEKEREILEEDRRRLHLANCLECQRSGGEERLSQEPHGGEGFELAVQGIREADVVESDFSIEGMFCA